MLQYVAPYVKVLLQARKHACIHTCKRLLKMTYLLIGQPLMKAFNDKCET